MLSHIHHILAKLIFCLVDTRSIQKDDLAALIGVDRLDAVSGCLRLVRCDSDLLADEMIHQRGFAHIWPSDQGYKAGFFLNRGGLVLSACLVFFAVQFLQQFIKIRTFRFLCHKFILSKILILL